MTSNNILEGEIETHDKCQIGLNSGVDFCYPCSGICETNDYVNGMTETVVELMLKQIFFLDLKQMSKVRNNIGVLHGLVHTFTLDTLAHPMDSYIDLAGKVNPKALFSEQLDQNYMRNMLMIILTKQKIKLLLHIKVTFSVMQRLWRPLSLGW